MKRMIRITILSLGALAAAASAQTSIDTVPASAPRKLAGQVRHELLMMPWYGVFDHIMFRVDGRAVTLMGAVTRPALRDEAGRRVKAVEGVETVDNQIRVLPLSPYDDRIRLASWQTIYSHPAFNRYALGAQPGIRLLVENGALTLEGVVGTKLERELAGILANGIPGVFVVKNELAVEGAAPKGKKS